MTAIFIQARIGSTRLPSKVLTDLCGETMLAQIVKRCRRSKEADLVVVVTPDNDIVEQVCMPAKVSYSLYKTEGRRDALAEFYHAAKAFNVDTIVRVTGDCPCVMPEMIDKMIDAFEKEFPETDILVNRNDNLENCTEIDGLDIEIFGRGILEQAHREAEKPEDLEHVTKWMINNGRMQRFESGWNIRTDSEIKLSVDTQEDLDRIRAIYKVLGDDFNERELFKYLEKENE